MFPLQFIGKLVKILHSAATPGQIAGGFILGMIMGLTPFWSLHNLVVILILILLNVNIAMAIFGLLVCSMFAYLLDPLFHSFGYFLLVDLTFMEGIYTALYGIPVIALSRFNNTVIMGSLASSIILLIPVFILIKGGVIHYRESVMGRMEKWKIVKAVKGSKVYSWYSKYAEWRS